jgi:hypothetical protein
VHQTFQRQLKKSLTNIRLRGITWGFYHHLQKRKYDFLFEFY